MHTIDINSNGQGSSYKEKTRNSPINQPRTYEIYAKTAEYSRFEVQGSWKICKEMMEYKSMPKRPYIDDYLIVFVPITSSTCCVCCAGSSSILSEHHLHEFSAISLENLTSHGSLCIHDAFTNSTTDAQSMLSSFFVYFTFLRVRS